MLQRTLDMLVLRTLLLGSAHGYTIAHSIEQGSDEVVQIDKVRCIPRYTSWKTAARSKAFAVEASRWEEVVRAISRVLNPAAEKIG
jgi:hypothetical protein